MAIGVKISLNEKLYLRDPQETSLGQKMIKNSILLIHEIGFERFNFKKLAQKIESTEASMYRYFENKHLLLLYLVTWYWEWVHYLIDINMLNVTDPKEKIKIIIRTLVMASKDHPAIDYVNESILHQIIISDGAKVYHTKDVDEGNKNGFFINYKSLVMKVADVIQEINPDFKYPRAMASSLFEMANDHVHFSLHLPKLTEVKVKDDDFSEVEEMLEYFTFILLG